MYKHGDHEGMVTRRCSSWPPRYNDRVRTELKKVYKMSYTQQHTHELRSILSRDEFKLGQTTRQVAIAAASDACAAPELATPSGIIGLLAVTGPSLSILGGGAQPPPLRLRWSQLSWVVSTWHARGAQPPPLRLRWSQLSWVVSTWHARIPRVLSLNVLHQEGPGRDGHHPVVFWFSSIYFHKFNH